MTNNISDLVIALAVVVLIGLAMRWAFRSSRPPTGPLVDASDSADLGLLQVIASGLSRPAAMNLRAELGEAEIRSSMSHRRNGGFDVLVFRTDLDRAHKLLDRDHP